MFCVYLNQTCNKKTYLLQMLQLFYNVIEDQKHYYSDPIYRTFDYVHLNRSSCVPGSAIDVCFRSRVSPIMSVPDPSFSVLGLGSHPYVGSPVSPTRWVPGLGSYQKSWVPFLPKLHLLIY